MPDPSFYSFKLPDTAGTIIYSPYADGPATSGWRALAKSHTTIAPNASLQFSWKGTGITISGTVNSTQGPAAYMLSLDGQPATQEIVDQAKGVLLSKTALPLAYHTIVLSNIAGSNLTVKELDVTISTGAKGTMWDERWVLATDSSRNLNPFFTFTGNWFTGTSGGFNPPMLTNTPSVLSFNLTKCAAFFLYGPTIPGSGAPYNVKITPPVHTPSPTSFALNNTFGKAISGDQDAVLFWESGMDVNLNYTVDINILPSAGQWGMHKLVIFDSTDLGYDNTSASKLGGQIGGVIGGIVGLIMLCLCLYACKWCCAGTYEVWHVRRV